MLFGSDVTITSDHLPQLEQTMTKIIKEGQDFCLLPTTPQQSLDILTMTNQIYKQEMRQEFLDRGDAITFYINTIKLAAKDALLKDVDP